MILAIVVKMMQTQVLPHCGSTRRSATPTGAAWAAFQEKTVAFLAAVVDSLGNLYICGTFTAVGYVASSFAQWNGSAWLALGSGISVGDENGPYVDAGRVGEHVVCWRRFHVGGRQGSHNVTQWNGISWSALGSGSTRSYAQPHATAVMFVRLGWFDQLMPYSIIRHPP